ncbi:hypothetical protein BJV77DRAFT_108105 [Russula vinacea]|nr:hypothetical protein BJV77DRAFT_108105 [Russula vinacea]
MQIKKLKVRPQKNPPVVLCGPELASMLGCWAATKTSNHSGLAPSMPRLSLTACVQRPRSANNTDRLSTTIWRD